LLGHRLRTLLLCLSKLLLRLHIQHPALAPLDLLLLSALLLFLRHGLQRLWHARRADPIGAKIADGSFALCYGGFICGEQCQWAACLLGALLFIAELAVLAVLLWVLGCGLRVYGRWTVGAWTVGGA
jgi:hypothetical protein